MFFDDAELGQIKKRAGLKIPPPVPDTGWRAPAAFPNLSEAVVISIDTETKEPDFDHGPGWARGKGHIVGFSLAAENAQGARWKGYFPVRHEFQPETNLDPSQCFRWLKAQLETPHIPKVGANLLYDIGWLTEENIFVQGDLHDVQFAEAILNEEGDVNLEHLGQKYSGRGKESNVLYEWLSTYYGGSANSTQRENIYRAPASLVGHYAESDADLPLDVLKKQWPRLWREGLHDVYRMECDLIYLLTRMRITGVNIDIPAAEQLYAELAVDIRKLNGQLYDACGLHANVNSGDDLAKVFDKLGIHYPRTPTGKPSFKKDFLAGVEHPVAELIRSIREHEKIRGTFIRSYLLESNVNGRVHCQFHPLRGGDADDSTGARTGRFASANPNLQNIPVRTDLGKKCRGLFIPDYGHVGIEKDDYSQIEYRFLAHFAVGPGSEELRAEYNANPRTDYHDNTHYRLCPFMGWNPEDKAVMKAYRKPIKNINFGLVYGMGKAKLTRAVMEYFKGNLSPKDVKALFEAYHAANPYVRATMDAAANKAQHLGYVTTVLGRRRRFNEWEPRQINYEKRAMPLPLELAIKAYGPDIIRANTHKGINSELQGSAADMIKKGMWRCWKEGVFDVIGVPKLQVHDELVFSVRDNSPAQNEAYAYMRHVLETAIPLKVPVLVDSGRGANWGSIE